MLPLDTLRRAVRARVCADCPRKTPGWTDVGPGAAVPCEGACPLFSSLPALLKTAALVDPMLRDPRKAMESTLDRSLDRCEPLACGACTACAPETSSLDRQQETKVMTTIEELLKI